ncbi:uncharacterized protein LOC115053395 isoform X2 [Echeneis naucrates]|uniref:uncharacterized protein LOC115053395 isoform X2 n=1 Tax=Echeneis naucrates TaxID=173247 RepID=UPI0011139B2A|nr:uncharacterized protein LOC115053395 isoform X2 [Echeneis naucrates]
MKISIHFTLQFFWLAQEFVSCVNMKVPNDTLRVELGVSLTLNCTYDCSTGFVRGCWIKAQDKSVCHGTLSTNRSCTTSLHLSNVTAEDVNKSYICYTQRTDDPELPQKTERIVLLQLEAKTSLTNWTATSETETKNASLPVKPEDPSGGDFKGIQFLAAVSVAVVVMLTVLATYLCLKWNRQSWNEEPVLSRSSSQQHSDAAFSPVKGSLSIQSERVTLRIPTSENDSATEVPYADIMIAARGVSTPELTKVCYLNAGDHKELWGDEPKSHLQASRSADRLHVPREVSRKMSTNSEYAVITYA